MIVSWHLCNRKQCLKIQNISWISGCLLRKITYATEYCFDNLMLVYVASKEYLGPHSALEPAFTLLQRSFNVRLCMKWKRSVERRITQIYNIRMLNIC